MPSHRSEPQNPRCEHAAAGGISKSDLKRFLLWAADNLGYMSLRGISAAPPTAELEPLKDGEIAQTDEADMGMTYQASPTGRRGRGRWGESPCCAVPCLCLCLVLRVRVCVAGAHQQLPLGALGVRD